MSLIENSIYIYESAIQPAEAARSEHPAAFLCTQHWLFGCRAFVAVPYWENGDPQGDRITNGQSIRCGSK